MSDHAKLKELAENYLRLIDSEEHDTWAEASDAYDDASDADTVLALIAENERLQREEKNDAIAYKAAIKRQEELRIERDQYKAEIDEDKLHFSAMGQALEDLVAERNQVRTECERLLKDADRYQWLRRNYQTEAWQYLSHIAEAFRDEIIDEAIKKEAEFFSDEGHAKQH